jgi:GT2 family glycosyltransferase
MKCSIIISSMNRKATFLRLANNIAAQTSLPDEIILVEAGGAEWSASELPEILQSKFRVLYAPNEALSSSRARGQQNASGEILFFFDDDIVIPNNYIAKALDYLATQPAIMAIGGAYTDKDAPERAEGNHRLAQMFYIHGDGSDNRLLPSGWTDFVRGTARDHITAAEWLFGCNFVVRTSAFAKAKFETRMKAWCFLEDVFFGQSLFAAFGNCMRLLPQLQVLHDPPTSGGRISKITLRMRILYRYILWREHAPRRGLRLAQFSLSMLGNILLMIKQEPKFWVVPDSLRTLGYIIIKPHMNWDEANGFIFS